MDMIGNCEQVKIEQNMYSTSNEPYFLIMSYFLEHCALSALHSHVYYINCSINIRTYVLEALRSSQIQPARVFVVR